MKIELLHSPKILTAKLVLLCLPTVAVSAYLFWHLNQYYTALDNQWLQQTIYFSTGLLAGCLFYNYRFRIVTTFLPLLVILYITSLIIYKLFTGEFSAFYAAAQYTIFCFLFITGILAGLGFARSRYFPTLLCGLLLIIQIIVVSKTTEITAQKLIIAFIPVLFFSLYIVYSAELVRNMNPDEHHFAWYLGKRLIGFIGLATTILIMLLTFFKNDFKAIEKEFGGGAKQEKPDNSESLTKENRDGTVSNNKSMGLSGGRRSSKRLVFIAKLDNYFPDTQNPNPLYFTYDYYTKFDTLTQTLETDSLMPSNDLFQPDPSKIPLYFTKIDSAVLIKAKGTIDRKVVTTEVYKSLLSPSEFLAPSTAFFCQPISIDKEYQQQFKSAYRAKMYVSDLNSAYFVYNPAGNVQLETFQQSRFDLLRKVTNWNQQDANFMSYYTFIPRGNVFDSVRLLAEQITKSVSSPIDKIIAIRNYFLSKDDNGQPLFKYTDNPGIPGLPSASKLNYFLFENRKGYCAYYAGATLFLLRALGIPSRISTGFLTVNRADKNKGWYWFYEDQAHAWVQVFFPGYGWLDFDTTIPSTDQQQSPAPDGTPPITVQSAYFVANGKVTAIDTVSKKMVMAVSKLIYHDKTFELVKSVQISMDISLASVFKDSGSVNLSALSIGIEVTALSFSERFKSIIPSDKDSLKDILSKIPVPAPIDEIRITGTENAIQPKKASPTLKQPFSLLHILWLLLFILAIIGLIILAIPTLIYYFFRIKARTSAINQKIYYDYISTLYLLNQIGFSREDKSPLSFAKDKVDPFFNTDLAAFILIYQKKKYSDMPLFTWEEKLISLFYISFMKSVTSKITTKKRISFFLNFYRTINFFTPPKI